MTPQPKRDAAVPVWPRRRPQRTCIKLYLALSKGTRVRLQPYVLSGDEIHRVVRTHGGTEVLKVSFCLTQGKHEGASHANTTVPEAALTP